jgi:hypothetical protein
MKAPGLQAPEQDVVDYVKASLRMADTHQEDWRESARELYSFVAGEQWDELSMSVMREKLRPIVSFNLTGKYVDAIAGIQIANRQQIKYYPRELGDVEVNEVLTGAVQWFRDESDAEDEESDAFVDLAICGMGWIEHFMDYDGDPEGLLMSERRDPLEMRWDATARKRNVRDAQWLARIKPMMVSDIAERWPDAEVDPDADDQLTEADEDFDTEVVNPRHYYEGDDPEEAAFTPKQKVIEFQYWRRETLIKIATPYGTNTFTPAQANKLRVTLQKNGVQFKELKLKQKVYYRAYLLGSQLLEHEKLPYQQGFTFQCMTGKRDRNNNWWYGVVKPMVEPQLWFNKFFSQILHIVDSNAKGGVMYEKSAVMDINAFERDWASPDKTIMLNDGALEGKKIQERPEVTYPQGIDRLMQFAQGSFGEVTGLNLEFMGMANRQQPGILEHQRKQAAISVLGWMFDALRRYHKDAGSLYAYYVREYMADGRLIRIVGKEGMKVVPLIRDQMTTRFDVIVDEAPTSVNMKERVWLVLTEMLPMLVKMGLPVPPNVFDFTPLPASLAADWKKLFTEPNPERQKQQDLATRTQEAKIGVDQSKKVLQMAQAQKTAAETGKTISGE